MMKRKKEKPKDTRQLLLDTAMELIWQNSYGSVSVDDICKKAGIQKGSFYHFFPSKVDLAAASFEEHWQNAAKDFDHIFSPMLSPLDRIETYCDVIYAKQLEKFKIFGQVCGCPYATIGAEMSTQNEIIRAMTQEIFTKALKYLENTLRDAAELGIIADKSLKDKSAEIYSYVMGVLFTARIQNDLEYIRRNLKTGIYRIMELKNTPAQKHQPTIRAS